MSFVKLERHLAEKAAREAKESAETKERAATLALKRTVREMLPKDLKVPRRPRGRTPQGGVSRKEVASLRAQAARQLKDDGGVAELTTEIQRTALVILKIDGILGTEPWRAAGGHGGLIAANARLRYLENAARLLDDIRRGRRSKAAPSELTAGVFDTPAPSAPEAVDAEVVK